MYKKVESGGRGGVGGGGERGEDSIWSFSTLQSGSSWWDKLEDFSQTIDDIIDPCDHLTHYGVN